MNVFIKLPDKIYDLTAQFKFAQSATRQVYNDSDPLSVINRYKRIIINIYLSGRVAWKPPRAQGISFNVENLSKKPRKTV